MTRPPPADPLNEEAWWQRRWLPPLLVLLTLLPLLYPTIPPLTDLPGHMGRWRVQLAHGQVPELTAWYSFDWQLIGNLGLDLLIVPMAAVFGLELGAKLLVLAIPALTVVGLLWIAREVHGRLPPTAFFALPFAYGHPFQFGFVNSALSMALALNAFALWLRLARLGRTRLRAVVFVPISAAIWLCHTFGWGMLGVLAFSAEMVRQHDLGRRWGASLVPAGIHCLSLAPPALLMVLWRSGGHVSGQTFDWFNWKTKLTWIRSTLRDRWPWFDQLSVIGALALVWAGVQSRRLTFSRNLAASAIVLLLVFICLPRVVFGSAYADMRLTPSMVAMALIAIRPTARADRRFLGGLALVGLAFFAARIGATTASYWRSGERFDRALAALDHVPRGARLVTFVGASCGGPWFTERMEHIGAVAIVRRDAFSNDQWAMAGAQLLGIRLTGARGFDRDPSELVTPRKCPREIWRPIEAALRAFPRRTFQYVWLVNPPPFRPQWLWGTVPVWTNGRDRLYRVLPPTPAEAPR